MNSSPRSNTLFFGSGTLGSRLFGVLFLGGGLGALLLLGLLPCPTATLLRIPCPGCGMTRATLCLLRGDWGGMVRFHPLAPLILLFLSGYFGANTWGVIRQGTWGWVEKHTGPRGEAFLWGFLGLVLGVWIARFAGALGGPVPV